MHWRHLTAKRIGKAKAGHQLSFAPRQCLGVERKGGGEKRKGGKKSEIFLDERPPVKRIPPPPSFSFSGVEKTAVTPSSIKKASALWNASLLLLLPLICGSWGCKRGGAQPSSWESSQDALVDTRSLLQSFVYLII